MRILVSALALLLLPQAVVAQGPFPPVNQLPSVPGLPNPLLMFDGVPVTTAEQWFDQRRPELKALFEHYMYGVAPEPPSNLHASIIVNKSAHNGSARLKVIRLEFGPDGAPHVDLLLVTPNNGTPAPIVIYPNQSGNHGVHADPDIPLTEAGGWFAPANDSQRGQATFEGFRWNTALQRGYGIATFYIGELSPDQPGFGYGIHKHYFSPGFSSPGHHEWAALAAWAWGISRAIDYLVTDPDVNEEAIIVTGWSRTGKAALLAGAFDERIAVTVPIQSGTGGAGPSRNLGYGPHESVQSINSNFPYWFNGEFKGFNSQPNRLPFDQHALVAMCAPRAVLVLHATNDPYSHPRSEFDILVAASHVSDMLGIEGIATTSYPSQNQLVDSRIGFWRRSGGHGVGNSEWHAMLDFADIHAHQPPPVRTDPSTSGDGRFSIDAVYPNPFGDLVTFEFHLPSEGAVRLRVIDMLGRHIATYLDDRRAEGVHHLVIESGGLPSGVYVYQLEWNSIARSGMFLRQ